MGTHCQSVRVLLHVSTMEEGPASGDHEATWLLGHTQRMSFLDLWKDGEDLYCDAVIHVPCKFLDAREEGKARCKAHGFAARIPKPRRRSQQRQLGRDRFRVVDRGQVAVRTLDPPPRPGLLARALPVLQDTNPCVGAPCETSDHTRGAACCRDLQIEIMCSRRQVRLESLIRSRKPPYLCKVARDGDHSLEAEVISACGYLEEGGVACTLHGRKRADGRSAKPELCFDWPPKREILHPGCVFGPKRRRNR